MIQVGSDVKFQNIYVGSSDLKSSELRWRVCVCVCVEVICLGVHSKDNKAR